MRNFINIITENLDTDLEESVKWVQDGHGDPKPIGSLPDITPEEAEKERAAAAERVAAKRAARAKAAKEKDCGDEC